jgi:hypothetical protein
LDYTVCRYYGGERESRLYQARLEEMNIIYMHSHDTGRYIQPYGYNIPTPNLQIFAEKGVLFRNAHCTAPKESKYENDTIVFYTT